MACYNIDGILNGELNNFVNPDDYGAFGNGIANDTTAFQKAINSGRPIQCTSGKTYELSSPIRVKSNTIIDLNGSTLTNRNSSTSRMLFNFETDSTFTAYNGNGNIIIRNGYILEGGFNFAHAENILLDNIIFKNSRGAHFLEICACKNVVIRNCSFIGMFARVASVKEYINIDLCNYAAFPYVTDENSPFYDEYKNDGLYIYNCYFSTGTDNTYKNGYNAIGVHYSVANNYVNRHIIIKNNYFEGFENCAIRLNDMESVIIENNDINTIGNGILVGDKFNVSDFIIAFNYFNVSGSDVSLTPDRYSEMTKMYNVNKGDTE